MKHALCRLAAPFAALMLTLALSACALSAPKTEQTEPIAASEPTEPTEATEPTESNNTEDEIMVKQAPIATIEMENGGVIKIELDYSAAPNTVKNFIALSNSGFYDGVIFHRVIAGFMIQGGDPDGTGTGGPGYRIKGEFSNNNVKNDIKHERGVISMARQGNPYFPASAYNTAGSQFFIMHADAPSLNKDYAAFGHVIEGMDVVDAVAATETDRSDRPVESQTIRSIRVETFGVDFGEPEKIVD